jgi:ZIP family zinc transporter/zinc and cadmium transporter
MASEGKRARALGASVAVGAATLIGVLVAFGISTVDARSVGYAFAFTAGSATYVGASDLIPEINHSSSRVAPVVVFAGMLLFYLTWLVVEGTVR